MVLWGVRLGKFVEAKFDIENRLGMDFTELHVESTFGCFDLGIRRCWLKPASLNSTNYLTVELTYHKHKAKQSISS